MGKQAIELTQRAAKQIEILKLLQCPHHEQIAPAEPDNEPIRDRQ